MATLREWQSKPQADNISSHYLYLKRDLCLEYILKFINQ